MITPDVLITWLNSNIRYCPHSPSTTMPEACRCNGGQSSKPNVAMNTKTCSFISVNYQLIRTTPLYNKLRFDCNIHYIVITREIDWRQTGVHYKQVLSNALELLRHGRYCACYEYTATMSGSIYCQLSEGWKGWLLDSSGSDSVASYWKNGSKSFGFNEDFFLRIELLTAPQEGLFSVA